MKSLEELSTQKLSPVRFPTIWEVLAIAALSFFLTALEIKLSQQTGILANPIPNDGISYFLETKQLFYRLGQGWFQQPSPLVELIGNRYPLWTTLMLLSQAIFGEGEWQCYSIHFWPTFFLLLLLLWVIRSRSNAYIAWTCVMITGLLPIVSTSLRAAAKYYFSSPVEITRFGRYVIDWYLTDARPNVFCTVLLLWAVVILVEHVRCLNRNLLLLVGTFAALSLLAKATYLPMIIIMMGLTLLYVGWVNRNQLRSTILTCCWGLLPFLILTLPWAIAGGLRFTIDYIYWNAIVNGSAWAKANRTFLSESIYYWNLFPKWFGPEGWLVLILGVLSFGILGAKLKRVDDRLLAYLGLAAIQYGFVSASQVKDYFSGNLYYLLLWIFCWIAISPVLLWVSRGFKALPLVFVGLYLVLVLSRGIYASLNWFPEYQVGLQNYTMIQQIGKDLKGMLTPEDCFVPSDASNATNIQYYTIHEQGEYAGRNPRLTAWVLSKDIPSEAEINSFLEKHVSQCKAILVHEGQLEEAARFFALRTQVMPFYQIVQQWVKRPDSPYKPGPLYTFAFNDCQKRTCESKTIQIRLYQKV
ncbi:hypothetical protein K9N68_20640 [Kovacikia minuta CCNUW1]|uniref:hypothetical protein n=1 Tax=Kovacikia minuta TaxID=2931930 RepID=UPI001CC9930E|nr:hypothetical protein [Kovacikia minuta]UBF24122.1 hypothetical protein K9N68_20640 [Kovacikia minuta CCNUW1]